MQDKQDIRCSDIRCGHCGKLLAKGYGVVEIKCPRCKSFTIVRAGRPDTEPRDGLPEAGRAESGQPFQRGGTV